MKIGKEKYVSVVLKIEAHDHFDGRPRLLRALYDEEKTQIEGGEEFIVAFVPKQFTKPKSKGAA